LALRSNSFSPARSSRSWIRFVAAEGACTPGRLRARSALPLLDGAEEQLEGEEVDPADQGLDGKARNASTDAVTARMWLPLERSVSLLVSAPCRRTWWTIQRVSSNSTRELPRKFLPTRPTRPKVDDVRNANLRRVVRDAGCTPGSETAHNPLYRLNAVHDAQANREVTTRASQSIGFST
jgi:hypothetical protein